MQFFGHIKFHIILLLLFICYFNKNTWSQESVGVAYNTGPILIHSSAMKELINEPVKGFTLNYGFANNRGKEWREFNNFPNYGLSYNFKSYGNPEILGNSHSLTSFLQVSFFKKRNIFDVGFKGFAGMGYFSKVYDAKTNPLNKAISAHFNISAEARLYSKIRIKPFFLEYSFGLNHFSNGLTKVPNLGINVLNNTLGFGYELEEQAPALQLKNREKRALIKNEFWGFTSFGVKEVEEESKRYTFSSISLNYSKQVSVLNKLGLGFDFLNDPSLTSFAYHQYHFLGRPDFNYRYGLNVHNEFLMGKTGLFAAYGIYLRKSDFYISQFYYKAGFKFYHRNIIAILFIRAIPLFRADVVEFGLGYRFNRKKQE